MAAEGQPTPKPESSSGSANTNGNGINGHSNGVNGHSSGNDSDMTITINDKQVLTLQQKQVVLERTPEETWEEGSGICGLSLGTAGSPNTIIPLYNVLWAERDGTNLHITYAQATSKHKFRPSTITVGIAANTNEAVDGLVEALLSRAYGRARRQKRAKVLVNPHAGPGGAVNKWHHDVEPLFKAARMSIDMQQTVRSGEAISIARDLDITQYDTVIACSGDGLPYEVINGLGLRPDARHALEAIAVCQIPCGSGNAMSCSTFGTYQPAEAALALIKGVDTTMDLTSITQGEDRKLSFLSQAVGIIAEADLGTENMRWMGNHRFTVGVATRIFKKKAYPCDIAVKVEMDNKEAIRAHHKQQLDAQPAQKLATKADGAGLPALKYGTVSDALPGDGWQSTKYDNMGNFYVGNMPLVAPESNFFPAALPNDGLLDLVTINSDISILSQIGLLTSVGDESAGFFANANVNYRKVTAYRFTPREQKDGYISIDGERIPFAPFQAEIHPGLGKTYSKTGRYEAAGP
ncbi:hypothetical protein ACHAQA_007008 [Verticillium albo-atrum]